jgi:hypothetical protein
MQRNYRQFGEAQALDVPSGEAADMAEAVRALQHRTFQETLTTAP